MWHNETTKTSRGADEKKRLLFFHNTLPEYRIEFWNCLNNMVDLTVAILEPELESKIYGFEIGNVKFCTVDVDRRLTNLEQLILNADVVILPPIDDLRCIKATQKIKRTCKKKEIPYLFWTEKWEAPVDRTPLKKRIKNYIQRILFRMCSSGSKTYLASGTKAREYLIKIGIPKDKIRVAIDSSTSPDCNRINIRERYGIGDEKKIILYLGRLIKRKGCNLLIMACKDDLHDWNTVLLICGDGEMMAECKMLAKGNESIIFAGKVQPSERRSYYEQSDLFVLPSVVTDGVVEGWGLAVNEALECGTPVVVTTAVGAGFDIVEEKNGIIVDDGEIDQLRKALKTRISTSLNREEICIIAKQHSVENMSKSFSEAL